MKQVITHDGKYGVIIFDKNEQCEVRYYNNKTNWYRKHQLTEFVQQVTKPPSRERDHLLHIINAIDGMHKTSQESTTDFAQGAEMAYRLVLDMLNDLK